MDETLDAELEAGLDQGAHALDVDRLHDAAVENPIRNEAGDMEDEIAAAHGLADGRLIPQVAAQQLDLADEGLGHALGGEQEYGDRVALPRFEQAVDEAPTYEA